MVGSDRASACCKCSELARRPLVREDGIHTDCWDASHSLRRRLHASQSIQPDVAHSAVAAATIHDRDRMTTDQGAIDLGWVCGSDWGEGPEATGDFPAVAWYRDVRFWYVLVACVRFQFRGAFFPV